MQTSRQSYLERMICEIPKQEFRGTDQVHHRTLSLEVVTVSRRPMDGLS
jgi:hypothetical protein